MYENSCSFWKKGQSRFFFLIPLKIFNMSLIITVYNRFTCTKPESGKTIPAVELQVKTVCQEVFCYSIRHFCVWLLWKIVVGFMDFLHIAYIRSWRKDFPLWGFWDICLSCRYCKLNNKVSFKKKGMCIFKKCVNNSTLLQAKCRDSTLCNCISALCISPVTPLFI